MKRGSKISFIFLFVFLLPFILSASDHETELKAISPGSDLGTAIVENKCPTFSWTSVDWASGYKVAVFKAESEVKFSYEEISTLQTPVLSKKIKGKALSWTPSSTEGLTPGLSYNWYVQAVDEFGNTAWSPGRMFRIELQLIPTGIREELKRKMKELGLRDENINNIFTGVMKEREAVSKRDNTNNSRGEVTGTEGVYLTLYGSGAGGSTSAGTANSFFGYNSGTATLGSAFRNSFFGDETGKSNISGEDNCFFGNNAGYSNTAGDDNVFFGSLAGFDNTAPYNVFIGSHAGNNNTSGSPNMFIGYNSGAANTTASKNTFIGYIAGESNTSGTENHFMGHRTGKSNTTGSYNTFMGVQAGENSITDDNNTFLGYQTGFSNDGGGDNLFTGYKAGYYNTSGDHNTFIGCTAGISNTTAGQNTFIGNGAGYTNTTGQYNSYLGYGAGYSSTGSFNVFLGSSAGYFETGSNKLYIDNSNISTPLIYGEFDNDIVKIHGNLTMSNTSTATVFTVDRTDGATFKLAAGVANTQIGTVSNHGIKFTTNNTWKMRLNASGTLDMADGGSYNGTWNDASSIEFKENITDLSSEEAFTALKVLNPVKYNYKKYRDEGRVGFIAEHVPELVSNNDRKNLSAMDIVAVLTKVVKEQQETIRDLKLEQEKKIEKQDISIKKQMKLILELQKEINWLKKDRE